MIARPSPRREPSGTLTNLLALVGIAALCFSAGTATIGLTSTGSGSDGPSLAPDATPRTTAPTADAMGLTPSISLGPDLGDAWTTPPVWANFVDVGMGEPVAAEQYLVMLEGDTSQAAAQKVADVVGGTLVGHFDYLGIWKIQVPEPGTEADWQTRFVQLGEAPGVSDVAPVTLVTTQAASACATALSDPVYAGDNSKPYDMIGVGAAWDAYYASGLPRSPVHLGITDTVLTKNAGIGWEFGQLTFDGDPTTTNALRPATATDARTDGFHHADGVLGIIAGDQTNGGVAGIASPLGSSLIVSQSVLGGGLSAGSPASWDAPDGTSYTDAELLNTLHQIESGATVINGSWAASEVTDANAGAAAMWKAFFDKIAKDYPNVIFVYAAGNNGQALDGTNMWPAGISAPNVITVGNVTTANAKVASSNSAQAGSGAEVTLAAPGEQAVWGRGADGNVRAGYGGTSSAAPMVSATAALIRSIDPTLTAAQIKAMIVGSAAAGPADLGGKTLRVDLAVRKAIDAVRARSKLAPLTDAAIAVARNLCQIRVSAHITRRLDSPAGSSEWNVTITLATAPNTTWVSLVVDGKAVSTPQVVAAAGDSANWTVTVPKAGSTIVATRLDNGFWTAASLRDTGQAVASPSVLPSSPPTAADTPAPTPTPTPTPGPTPAFDCSSPPSDFDPIWSLACGGS
ncbi:MAG: S8 family serine peptidase [Candidatus Limnocylindrales bacterium]